MPALSRPRQPIGRARPWRRSPAAVAAMAVVIAVGGCGTQSSSSTGTASATPQPAPTQTPLSTPTPIATPAPSNSPTAAPSTTAPNDERRVELIQNGVVSYLDTTVPVVVVRNLSTTMTATAVVAHVRVISPQDRDLSDVDVSVAELGPGHVAALAARLGIAAPDAHLLVTLQTGPFRATPPTVVLKVPSPSLTCGNCSNGGSGDVTGNLTATPGPRSGPVTLSAVCQDAAGVVVAAGRQTVTLPPTTPALVDVPVVVHGDAAVDCLVSGEPVGF